MATVEEVFMSKQRRSFSPNFKREAARLVLDQGYSVPEACQSLGVSATALRRWVEQFRSERGGQTPSNPALTPEQQRIQELEARVKSLEQDKAILKDVPSVRRGAQHLADVSDIRKGSFTRCR